MKRYALPGLVVCLLAAPAAPGQTADEKKATVAFLRELQSGDGGFLPAPPDSAGTSPPKSSLRSTSSALRALKYFGGAPRDPKAAAAFVDQCFDKSAGAFADRPGGKPDVAVTAVGMMAALEAKLPAERYADAVVKYLTENAKGFDDVRISAAALEAIERRPPVADAWLKEVTKSRNDDGTYGKGPGAARDTGGAVAAFLRLGGKLERRDEVLKALRAGQRDDGGFGKADAKGSDLETSYRVMRCFMMLKEKPADVDGLKKFVAKCRNADGGYGVAPGQPSTASGTYYAGIVLHWLG
jgi:prenyltransferase beta subunit